MRRLLRFLTVTGILLAGWAAPPPLAQAANLDTIADDVLGQVDLNHNSAGVTASEMNAPNSLALDAHGDLYVADLANNRVLEFDRPLITDHIADRVFGQADFTHNTGNPNGVNATSLFGPSSVALDAAGNLYVADTNNNRVLEYFAPLTSGMAAGRVFGQGGSFTSGASNNDGLSAASLASPSGVALDRKGNLYVADFNNSRVLGFSSPLSASASYVWGQADFTHGIGNRGVVTPTASSLRNPVGLALDVNGNLYVADTGNNRVLEYDTPLLNGAADRVFGQPDFSHGDANHGGRSSQSFDTPRGVALDARGDLYAADTFNNRVLEFNNPLSNTVADRVFGQGGSFTTGASGLGPSSLFGPLAVAEGANGGVFVADLVNNRVLEFDLPVPRAAPSLTAISPSTVALGSPDFTLTLTGAGFYGVSVVHFQGASRPTTFINSTQLTATISAADVASGVSFAVAVFTPGPGGGTTSLLILAPYTRAAQDTTADMELGQPNFVERSFDNAHMLGANQLGGPDGLAVDLHSGRLFVADIGNNRVLSWPNAAAQANGQAADLVLGQPNFLATTANTGGLSAKSLYTPTNVALDAQGNLYVSDVGNNRVLEYQAPLSSGMAASRVFGQAGSFTTGTVNNGGVSASSLDAPEGLALDGQGRLYVADVFNQRVLEYDNPLTTDTTADHVFGQPNMTSHAPNQGLVAPTASSLSYAHGVTLDAAGNLYVADSGNSRVLEYNAPLSSGMAASHVFGQNGSFTTAIANNGGISANSLNVPQSMTLDSLGKLYVADRGNYRVLVYTTPLNNATAVREFGQPDFSSGIVNNGGIGANRLGGPASVALDGQGNLFVADAGNERVLEYDLTLVKLELPLIQR